MYDTEVAERICELIANTNMGLRAICQSMGLCYSTVYKWTMPSSGTYRARFRRMYLDAKEMQMAAMEEEIQEIAEDTSQDFMIQGGKMVPNRVNVARAKLRITTKQWMMGRLATRSKAMPEEDEERVRDWFVYGGYFVDLADRSTVDAWLAAEAYKQEKGKARIAAEATAAATETGEEATAVPVAEEPYFGGVYPSDIKDVVELPADALVWNEDRDVVDEQIAALREKYTPKPPKGGDMVN